MTTIIDKTYDPETGYGSLQCTKRSDGLHDLTIFHNDNDLTLYALTRADLFRIATALKAVALDDAIVADMNN